MPKSKTLREYLTYHRIKTKHFANMVILKGKPVTPARISQIKGGWRPSVPLALEIERVTGGDVTAIHLLGLEK